MCGQCRVAVPDRRAGDMISDFEGTALPPELSADGELPSFASERQPRPERGDVPGQAGVPGQQVREAAQAEQTAEPLAADPADQAAAILVTISETVERLAVSSERYRSEEHTSQLH